MRRTRTRLLGGLAIVALAVPLVAVLSADPEANTASASTPRISARALLQPSDVDGAAKTPMRKGEAAYLRPLRPCKQETLQRYPSDQTRVAAVANRYGTVVEFVGKHQPGGAVQMFEDIGTALATCPGVAGLDTRRWTLLTTGIAGDQSALVRIDSLRNDGELRKQSQYAALVRVGDYIVVVADLGTASSPDRVQRLAVAATARITAAG